MTGGLPLGQNGYLRVLTPQTTDGTNLRYTNGRTDLKETHLPLTARKHLERENDQLPIHLKHQIELVSEDAPVKGKPGRKKKEDIGAQGGEGEKEDE